MPDTAASSAFPAQLRSDAEMHIKAGTAPTFRGLAPGADTLSLLHRLASSPASAADALKLLHELQVHQVELDMQHEQIEQSWRELSGELARYAALFDNVPVACMSVDADGTVLDANLAAQRLCGMEHAELMGRRLDAMLAPQYVPAMRALLARTLASGLRETASVMLLAGTSGTERRIAATPAPGNRAVLLAFMDPADNDASR